MSERNGKGVTYMARLPDDLVVAIDDLLAKATIDDDDLEDEVETAQRAIAW